MSTAAASARRSENRGEKLLDAAARRFREAGYDATSMRDIAADVGMRAGSIYYHFPSKAELLVAVHEEGIRRINAAVDAALDGLTDPWARLEAFAAAHLGVLLDGGDYARVVVRELPPAGAPGHAALVALRDAYEARIAALIDDLPLAPGADRTLLRLMLIGALNWTQSWYRPGGRAPVEIAARFVAMLREPLEGSAVA